MLHSRIWVEEIWVEEIHRYSRYSKTLLRYPQINLSCKLVFGHVFEVHVENMINFENFGERSW